MASYEGPVVFVDGEHFPIGEDGEPDFDRPLRWEDGGYRDAEDGDALHNETYASGDLELEPGSEDE